jgi:histidinol phosphatase-like PHP family hydrolase
MEKEENLEDMKKDYLKFQKKYNLPEFDTLNQNFGIEKIAGCETDFLLREIRKFVSEKFSNYLRFIEAIIHPINSPLFVFSLVKNLGISEKDKLTEVYKKLAKKELETIELDISYDEEKEAIFLKDSFKLWEEIKKEILEVLEFVRKNWDNKFERNNKDYFG